MAIWAIFYQFWTIFGNFGKFRAIFGYFNIIVQGYLSNHIFHTVQQHQQAVNSTDASHHNVATVIFSAATPPATPMASPEGVNVMPVIKRDLVVRFREQKNSVQCEMAAAKRGDGNSAPAGNAATTPIQYKEQYEAQHYSRHPHGPMSPCDSENSVCNRSRENLIGKILPIRQSEKYCFIV